MTQCNDFKMSLDAYIDKCIDDEQRENFSHHIQSCASCREILDKAVTLEQGIKTEAATWKAPDNLWARIQHSTANEHAGNGTDMSANVKKLSWAAAAVMVLAIGVAGFGLLDNDRQRTTDVFATALVNEFHTFVVSQRELDFSGNEAEGVRHWFVDKVDFRVPLPAHAQNLKLSGGRLCNMFDQRVASFMYREGNAWVSLYIMRAAEGVPALSDWQESLVQGYGFIGWQHDGLFYSLIGDIPTDRLRQIAASLQSASFTQARTAASETVFIGQLSQVFNSQKAREEIT